METGLQAGQQRAPVRAAEAAILIVDDKPARRLALTAILEPLGHTLFEATSGEEALRFVMEQDFAVILIDVRMPVMDGYTTARFIGQQPRSLSTPIIFVTAYRSDEADTARGYASGAVDFIFLPFIADVVQAKVAVFVDLFMNRLHLERSLKQITTLGQAFRDAETRTRTILDNVADGIVTSGPDGLIETINRAASDLFGYREEDVFGRHFDLLLGPVVQGEVRGLAPVEPRDSSSGSVSTGLTETVGRRADGSTFPLELELTDIRLAGRMLRIACMRDISERKTYIDALEYQALHDSVTGLPNRTLFGDRLGRAIASAERSKLSFAVLILDLDGFKAVNDTLGHDRGDLLLRAVGERLRSTLRNSDTVARFGGDEFAILALGSVGIAGAEKAAWKVQRALEAPFVVAGHAVDVRASVGASLFPENGAQSDELLRRADLAMYDAKRNSSGFALYAASGEAQIAFNLVRLGELRHCIAQQELVLHYQPKIDLKTGLLTGVEALLRWNHPRDGVLYPDKFITHIERSELIRPVTRWVIDEALRQQRAWCDAGLDLTMAVNISGRSLNSSSELPDTLAELTEMWGTRPGTLVLELTEGSVIDSSVPAVLHRLHDMGHRLSIDDFGTGYSSLAYLQQLPVDEIKIDKSFVINLASNTADSVIVRSTVDLAHNLGLTVVAEGVEDEDALALLVQYGSDSAQGYFFSRPMAPELLERWLEASPVEVHSRALAEHVPSAVD